jgi:hypothetical protein
VRLSKATKFNRKSGELKGSALHHSPFATKVWQKQICHPDRSVAEEPAVRSTGNQLDREAPLVHRKSRLERSRQRLRKFVKPGRLLSDELIAERRGAGKRE